jgi:hypothetical protein
MQWLSAGVTMPLEAIYYHNPAAATGSGNFNFRAFRSLVPVACQWGALVRRSACQGSSSGPVGPGPARGPQSPSQGCQWARATPPRSMRRVTAPVCRGAWAQGSHSQAAEAAPQPAGGQGRGPRALAGPIPGLWATGPGTPCALAALHMATLGSYQPKRPGLAVCQWRWILAW